MLLYEQNMILDYEKRFMKSLFSYKSWFMEEN